MELWLQIDGETVDFDVTRDAGDILVTRDGVTWRVSVDQSGAVYKVNLEGKDIELARDGEEPRGLPGDCLVLDRGEAHQHTVVFQARRKDRASAGVNQLATDGAVFPLMPGTIIEVMVNVGDTVNEGDVLLVLEAMKMQNEVQSPVAWVVQEIGVGPGAHVDRGTMMVKIEPAAPGGS